MKIISLTFILILTSLMGFTQSFYDFKVTDIDGREFDFAQLKGKKVMVVNVASKCGYTSQYEQLQQIWETYGGENFVIIAFPANNFMNQEPGTDAEIKSFCTENYGVDFPVMSKISVKGDDIHPVYQWLTQKDLNGVQDSNVKWNFQKYLIDEQGTLVEVLGSRTKPDDEEIVTWIASK